MGSYSEFSLWKFLFGSIRKKLGFAFGFLVLLIIVLVGVTYFINTQISDDQVHISQINAPLTLMAQEVIGYDSMLTSAAYASLLHATKGEYEWREEHKKIYDEIGTKLDDLLKNRAKQLINQSRRSMEEKQKVYGYLAEIDRINLILVDLELGAFDELEKNDTSKAYSLIVSEEYHKYKAELLETINQWDAEEERIADYYRARILNNSRNVIIYNLGMGFLFIVISLIIPFLVFGFISKPINKLKDEAEKIEKGDFDARVDIKTGDEIEELGNTFNKMAEAISKTDEDRKQIDKAKTEFLSITSHELRSPMTPMKAQLQMILGNYFGELKKEQRESLEIVLNNTERLDKIIVDFLEISRIEAARLKFAFVRADLTKTIDSVIEEMKGFMPEKKIKIEKKIEKLPVIEVDPDRVSQVLRNLVNNAIKFTPENGNIEVSAKLSNGMILFSIKDNGVGIPEKDQRRLFEPFYQVDNMYQHKSGGTGLGLAISKGIVESQNGKIWINSKEGKGTVFYFTVPLKPIREIKEIKLLFSESQKKDGEINGIFKEYLGPLGEKEFENLRDSSGLTLEIINDYISYLQSKKVLEKEGAEEFKNKISIVLNEGVREKKIEKESDAEKRAVSFFKRGKNE